MNNPNRQDSHVSKYRYDYIVHMSTNTVLDNVSIDILSHSPLFPIVARP